jgi:hypothetical protein
VKPGFVLHAALPLVELGSDPVRADVLGTDLGWVTLGNGLLFEQLPLEGVLGVLSWRSLQLSYTYGGRALWDDDDLIRTQLSGE